MNQKEQRMKLILGLITVAVIAAVVVMVVFFSGNGTKNSDEVTNEAVVTESADKKESDKKEKQEKETKKASETKQEPETKPENKEEKKPEEKTASETAKKNEAKKDEKSAESVEQKPENKDETNTEAVKEEKKYTPLFMYFVTKKDSNYDEYMAAVEDLKKEYAGKVDFEIIDIDEKPEAKDNFPVEGNTPLLIMNNTKNEISGFGFKCGDKKQLKEYIDASF